MTMTKKDLAKMLSKRYNLDAVTAIQTVSLFEDPMTGRLMDLRSEDEAIAELERLEKLGSEA